MAAREHPDLILMDVRMPRIINLNPDSWLGRVSETQNIPVVFLSAKGQESEIQEGLGAGAVKYILKPFAPDDLTIQVNQVLEELGKA